jgi:hypothetical protein
VTSTAKNALLEAIVEFVGGQELLDRGDVSAALEREIDRDGPESLHALMERLSADEGWAYYPPDPLARRIHHLLAARFLDGHSHVEGSAHAATVTGAPVVIAANHCPMRTPTSSRSCYSDQEAPRRIWRAG